VTESEFRRRPSTDYRRRLEQAEDGLSAVLASAKAGAIPADDDELERCRLVAQRAASKARELDDRLSRAIGDALMRRAREAGA
jgi:hypothetical protein